MAVDLEDLRLSIYTSLAATGRAPETEALGAHLGADPEDIAAGLRQLAAGRHLDSPAVTSACSATSDVLMRGSSESIGSAAT
jgi:hypothetical protein